MAFVSEVRASPQRTSPLHLQHPHFCSFASRPFADWEKRRIPCYHHVMMILPQPLPRERMEDSCWPKVSHLPHPFLPTFLPRPRPFQSLIVRPRRRPHNPNNFALVVMVPAPMERVVRNVTKRDPMFGAWVIPADRRHQSWM